jgi:hypothetical protein
MAQIRFWWKNVAVLLCMEVEVEAFNFSLNEVSICKGKVWPFSQISRSFLILSYKAENKSKWEFKGEENYTWW